jgi:hypothetical protein
MNLKKRYHLPIIPDPRIPHHIQGEGSRAYPVYVKPESWQEQAARATVFMVYNGVFFMWGKSGRRPRRSVQKAALLHPQSDASAIYARAEAVVNENEKMGPRPI